MQQILPIFPQDMKIVNYQVGFKQIDDFVHYFVNGMPVYCHAKDDKNGYRFVLATLVNNKFCSTTELSESLGVNKKNVERYAKNLRDKGMSHFFNRKETRGQCYKFTSGKMQEAQRLLDLGRSQSAETRLLPSQYPNNNNLNPNKYFFVT